MIDPHELIGLLRGYAEGDILARKVLIDALAEDGDPRATQVENEEINWDRVAADLARKSTLGDRRRLRWLIDCVRYGSTAPAEVTQVVRQKRTAWLKKLFPECDELWE
jgi:hypothetical protein